MKRHNLKDSSFLIYTRIDSKDRLINLGLVIGHIQRYFDTNIVLWEMDTISKVSKKIQNLADVHYRFLKDTSHILHTTKYRNEMVDQCDALYFYVCDADVIASPEALAECVGKLRKTKKRTLVYPYNGDFYNVPIEIRKAYIKSGNYRFLSNREKKFKLWFRYSAGGIFGGRTSDFQDNGPDDERIYGWGPDDKERYYRLKKQGFKIECAHTPLYHLDHDRKANSWHPDEEFQKKNEEVYLDTFIDK